MVDNDNNVYFEFIEGNQTAVAKGNADIQYIVFRDKFTKSFKYSFDNKEVRKLAYNSIINVPHSGEEREMKFLPGYYELVIAQKNENSNPQTIFIDYRDNDAYQINWEKIELAKLKNK